MQNRLFRRIALERLSSPEQLDQLMPVTSLRAWLALLGFFILLGAVIIWSFVGIIPTTTDGEGILIRGGIDKVVAGTEGRLIDVYVEVGDVIESGQVIARILNEDDEQSQPVFSPINGRILEIRASSGDFVTGDSTLLITESVGADVPDLEAIFYLPATEGKKVRLGDLVQISPSFINPEEFGVMLGWVTAVGEFPESQQSMLRVLGNEELVNQFSRNGAPIAIRVELIPARTPTGYKWTSSQGPDVEIRSGTLATAIIILDEQRPVDMIFPGLFDG